MLCFCSIYTAPCLCSLLQASLVYTSPPHSSLLQPLPLHALLPMLCGFTYDWPIIHCCMIRCFMSRFYILCCASCLTAPCFMLLHAVCGSMLYTDPRLILLPPWICCCMPRSFMRTARTSHDHTSLLRASLSHALCLAVPRLTCPCFAVPCFVADALLGCF